MYTKALLCICFRLWGCVCLRSGAFSLINIPRCIRCEKVIALSHKLGDNHPLLFPVGIHLFSFLHAVIWNHIFYKPFRTDGNDESVFGPFVPAHEYITIIKGKRETNVYKINKDLRWWDKYIQTVLALEKFLIKLSVFIIVQKMHVEPFVSICKSHLNCPISSGVKESAL